MAGKKKAAREQQQEEDAEEPETAGDASDGPPSLFKQAIGSAMNAVGLAVQHKAVILFGIAGLAIHFYGDYASV